MANKTKNKQYLKEIKTNLLAYSGLMELYKEIIGCLLKERRTYQVITSILGLIILAMCIYFKSIGG